MIDVRLIRENPEIVRKGLEQRCMSSELLDEIVNLESRRREALQIVEQKKAERNSISSEIARAKASKDQSLAASLMERAKEISSEVKDLDNRTSQIDEELREKLLYLPNIPSSTTPVGKGEEDNVVLRFWGEPRKVDFEIKAHWDYGPDTGLIDFERAAKISGARFTILRGDLARLERAIANFMLDLHHSKGYEEVALPFMVKRETMQATGQLPKFEDEAYRIDPDDMFMIPTAEVPLVAQHMDEIIDSDLPKKYTAYSACFRREAGSYGKDVRGMIRVHQFDKVELVWFTHPDKSYDALESLTADAEDVLKKLELPYRVVSLCTGDIGFASAKTYDLEVWLPSYNTYREISSCSNVEDFQPRRANIRFRDDDNKLRFVHCLNGSGLAVGRTLVAIVENYQREDGKIVVPKVLVPYMGQEVIG
ncbi:seryl-tRNA synthetase [Mesotoga sp. Brook.08.YT.4.2.5.1]|uniref:serine--tRNA ligase n=1 Tax=unclassified Mesotoga TaxID=1184398 RepID=UPI000C9B91ED|nr:MULTISPECIES: serine--tRNA ligase [unclassified Mesotoga]PNQ05191.1 seryl-tRNA synthetase [Mesotoga sp. SC_NapDC3]PXF34197.1 seryl-tRNA synthetase [Mesotoga sp. SC_NapDC]MDD3459907.1 serine--tRNA ligase [Mesotoga sp.]PNE22388.1 seryl-tRNA synthetase [Mesotoga sp. Brook.08.YT.4.2.5.1]RAO96398.1 seryl-tRNA synthetase [Mesotoga sp. Brook.08.YT.4.2.5.4.]